MTPGRAYYAAYCKLIGKPVEHALAEWDAEHWEYISDFHIGTKEEWEAAGKFVLDNATKE